MNDNKGIDFFRRNRVAGPVIVAFILFALLYKFSSLGFQMSAVISIVIGVTDYVGLNWLLGRMENTDE